MRYPPDQKIRTRRRILEAAERTFKRSGFHGSGVDAALQHFGLDRIHARPTAQCSAGQKRRLGLARLMVVDRPGVFADIAATLRDEAVSMEAILQHTQAPGEPVPVVLTTHDVNEASLNRAVQRFAAFDTVVEPPCVIRIEPLAF